MTDPTEMPPPPRPERRETAVGRHGDVRVDEYAWLRDREDPGVLAHLEAENRYSAAMLGPTEDLQRRLYEEMVGRIQETDQSVPYREGDWHYYYRTVEGQQYAIHCRKRSPQDEREVVILDENALAAASDYLHVGVLEVSPDGRLLAYAVDENGDEHYDIRVKDLESGELLDDRIDAAAASIAWAADSATLFYIELDHASRPYRVRRHELGTPRESDPVVHHEEDERFFLGLERSKCGHYILLEAGSHVTSEVRYLESSSPRSDFAVVMPRRQHVEYEVVPHGHGFFVLTNDEAKNFRVMRAPLGETDPGRFTEVIPHDPDVFLTGVDVYRDHLVVYLRRRGQAAIRIRRLSTGEEHEVAFDEPAYTVADGDNFEFDTVTLRFEYSSLVTPRSIFDYDMNTRERRLLKQTVVKGGYDPSRYHSERIIAVAEDGAEVPISLFYRRDTPLDGSAKALLVGYGSYGMSAHPRFASDRLSLVDRGFVYAIAHIRGGGLLGRLWYEAGKLEHKSNTFGDFIACAQRLVAGGYTSPSRLAITGGSAGGLLMGAVLNRRPELFGAAVAEVPFVDPLNTMLDETLPLTVIEYEEWGNPNEPAPYGWIKSYSPYDNVASRPYPAILVTAGLNDPRVGYWEAAKWVARLRDHTTSDRPILLKVQMGAGHQGVSGRYDWLKERALVFAFVIDAVAR